MNIAVIQASSQAQKNKLLFDTVSKHAIDDNVINFGCTEDECYKYSYVEISLLIGLLINSSAIDFVVTGCSSGQGMMLACNSMPGVIAGYAPTPKDAYLFCQINNGNVISLPFGEDYTWSGSANFNKTIEAIFSEPFGQGYPKSEAERKLKDTALLKQIRNQSQVSMTELMRKIDTSLVKRIRSKQDVIQFIINHGHGEVVEWLKEIEQIHI